MKNIFKFLALLLVVLGVFITVLQVRAATPPVSRFPRLSEFEMTDIRNGDLYCMWIKNGMWHQIQAACSSDEVAKQGGPSVSENTFSATSSASGSADVQTQIDALRKIVSSQQKQIVKLGGEAAPSETTTPATPASSATTPAASPSTPAPTTPVTPASTPAPATPASGTTPSETPAAVSLNKTALESAISAAQGKVEADYTHESWLTLQTDITAATTADTNTSATQADIDTAAVNLNNAISGLVSATAAPASPSAVTSPSATSANTSAAAAALSVGIKNVAAGFINGAQSFALFILHLFK